MSDDKWEYRDPSDLTLEELKEEYHGPYGYNFAEEYTKRLEARVSELETTISDGLLLPEPPSRCADVLAYLRARGPVPYGGLCYITHEQDPSVPFNMVRVPGLAQMLSDTPQEAS